MTRVLTIPSLLKRGAIFLAFFVAISGMVGPRIVNSDILFRDGFALYGGVGKALIFGLIALVLLVRRRVLVTLSPWHWPLGGYFLAAVGALILAWVSVSALLDGERSRWLLVEAHGGLLLCVALVFLGCFGVTNVRLVWREYRRDILTAGAIAVGFYVFLLGVYALWRPLALGVLQSVKWLLGMNNLAVTVLPPYTLVFDKFSVTIAEYCSGVESIALFTSLYAMVGLLDWHRFNKKRYFLTFPVALTVLFGLNILRVYGLIMAGYYIDPKLAFSLFHTYAGMVFFIIYSAVFWAIAYKYLINEEPQHT